jgi:cold shock CspA family protein
MKGWKEGTVAWFNDLTGDGVVVSSEGARYYVHYSSIKGSSRLTTGSRRSLEEGQRVKFKALRANYVNQVEQLVTESDNG